jgi:carboxymethylenebutenolidase
MMNRRTFLCRLTLGALTVPLAAEGQQARKVYRIGLLGDVPPFLDEAFRQGLRELGYVDGRTSRSSIGGRLSGNTPRSRSSLLRPRKG